ncbi:MAG: hypothetical protein QOH19_2879 [Actinomycetota bacterium]|jgi:hypothetical protein|nr:hypothetical protein [Actinomycetota bacterium]
MWLWPLTAGKADSRQILGVCRAGMLSGCPSQQGFSCFRADQVFSDLPLFGDLPRGATVERAGRHCPVLP